MVVFYIYRWFLGSYFIFNGCGGVMFFLYMSHEMMNSDNYLSLVIALFVLLQIIFLYYL
jgi:hypothetical protein